MADKIQVAVRVRPVLFQKKDVEVHWACEKGVVFQTEPNSRKRIGNPYLFDQVFGTETQNHQIFTELVQPLIDSAINGFNVTVLAYGQTASGKTYTMMGSQKEPGIVQLGVQRIFTLIDQNPERAFLLRCSYIEIYNETISDLLSSTHQKLKVQELAEGNVVVHNLSETNVNTPDAVLKLMQQGNKQRKVGGTSMNERSSRSHTIFRIIVESVPRDEADRSEAAVIVSHINLVDLAGSEKASQTNATGDRFREGCAINTSLSALSLVIKQLSEGEGFVNFRDSKLTHILRASLGGNARTAIICNVTPTVLDETSSTLKFACSAKAVQNKPQVNEVLSDQALLRKYNNYIKDLERKLKEKEFEMRPDSIEEMQRLLQEKDMKINELKEQLVVSSSIEVASRPEDISLAQRSLRRMTWGGNRLKQLGFPGPAVFESTPLFPRTVSIRKRSSNFSNSEMTLDEIGGEGDSIESETFLPAELVFNKPTDLVTKVDVATMTEVEKSPFKQPYAPGTPVPVLKERLAHLRTTLLNKEKENKDLREELEDLTNFTRLEQQIGVHAEVIAKNAMSPETAGQLHNAMQTANDMEVLYLDTQRKLSELQTEFRNKEVEHETEILTQRTNFQNQLDIEVGEKKRLAKELGEIREKYDRLERDQAEADIHVQVITERYAKRETDLRNTLQEAWAELERLGQDPKAIQENSSTKIQLAAVQQELLELKKCHEEAQARINVLDEELRQAKEQAQQASDAIRKDDNMHDNSLSGMCLADELRDVFTNQECSFALRSLPRTRKRPSSILSVALAKMDQSTSMPDSIEQEVEPSKRTRLSMQPVQPEEVDLEVKEIREYLIELQSVLVRYENDYEALSQEKELLNDQLTTALNELSNIRMAKNKVVDSSTSFRDEMDKSRKLDVTEEGLDSICYMGETSMSTSLVDMEQSVESCDQFVSLKDPMMMETSDSNLNTSGKKAEDDALAMKMQKLEESNKRKQELEEELNQVTDKFTELQNEFAAKSSCLEDCLQSLESAKTTIETHEKRECELLAELSQTKTKLDEVKCELQLKTDEFTIYNEEITSKLQMLSEELENKSDTIRQLEHSINDAASCSTKLESNNDAVRSELNSAMEKIQDLEEKLRSECDARAAMQQAVNEATTASTKALNDALAEKQEIEHQLVLVRNKVIELTSELEQSSAAFEKANLEINTSTKALNDALAQKQEVEDQLSQVQNKVIELTSELEQSSVAFEKAKIELGILKQTSQTEVVPREIHDALESELKEAMQRVTQLEGSLEATTAQLATSSQDLQAVEARAKVLEEADATYSTTIQSLERTVEELNAKNLDMNKTLDELRSGIQLKEEELLTLRSMSDSVSALETLLQARNDEITSLSQVLDQKTDQICKLEEKLTEITSRQEQLEQIENKYRERQSELENLRTSLEAMQKANNDLVDSLNAKENDVRSELRCATEKIQDLEEKLRSESDARVAVQQAANDAATASTKALNEALAQKHEVEDQLSQVRSKVTELTCELEQSSVAFEKAKIELSTLKQTCQTALVPREIHDTLESEWKEAMQRVAQLEGSLEATTAQLAASSQDLQAVEARAKALEKADAAHSTTIQSLERALEELTVKNMDMNKTVDELRSGLQLKEEELLNLRSMSENVSALETLIKMRNEEITSLSQVLEQKADQIRNLEENLAETVSSQSSRQERLEQIENKYREKQTELETLRTSLETMQKANDDLVDSLNAKENLYADTRKNLENTTQRFDMLHSKLETVQSEKKVLLERVKVLETEMEARDSELTHLRSGLNAIQNERELSLQLKQRLNTLETQYSEATKQCQQLLEARGALLENQERLKQDSMEMTTRLQSLVEVNAELEKSHMRSEAQKDAILNDYQKMKHTLAETENQLAVIQSQRDDYCNQARILSDQIDELRVKTSTLESSSKYQVQRQLEETNESLKRELLDSRSKSEIMRLNFETEIEGFKKKLERVDKELEVSKQQYIKCKEQLRLARYRPMEDGTVALPKPRISVSTESVSAQTDPIADKGFGFRWQMEQYVSDNERLRKKVSDLGERMEFYKEKLIKYRSMYFQMTGQEPGQRPPSSSSNSSQPVDRPSSTSSNGRENIADCPFGEAERNPKAKTLTNNAVLATSIPQPVVTTLQQQQPQRDVMTASRNSATSTIPSSSARWATGKKESLTKEEMEKINNCNPS